MKLFPHSFPLGNAITYSEQYHEAAECEQYYLLQFSFHIPNSHYKLKYGLRPARNFSPVIKIRMQELQIIFCPYQWNELVEELKKWQDDFFKKANLDV